MPDSWSSLDDVIRLDSFGQRGITPTSEGYLLSLPADNTRSAAEFLAMLGTNGLSGSGVGGGLAMDRTAIEMVRIRESYTKAIKDMAAEITRRVNAGESLEDVARWASDQRTRIARQHRLGFAAKAVFEIRDWKEYGRGGRTWENVVRRYETRPKNPLTGKAMHEAILQGAVTSNDDINQAIKRGANYLKYGGRVVLVIGVTASVARIWTASEQDMPKVIGEELGALAGGAVGGFFGAKAGVAICLAFGSITLGWGLLACGIAGAVGGGLLGAYGGSKAGGAIADGWYYSDANTPADQLENISIEIPVEQLYRCIPPYRCDFD